MTHARLFAPPSPSHIREETIRRRTFEVKTDNDILAVLAELRRERAVGSLRINLGPGGVLQSMQADFEQKVKA